MYTLYIYIVYMYICVLLLWIQKEGGTVAQSVCCSVRFAVSLCVAVCVTACVLQYDERTCCKEIL